MITKTIFAEEQDEPPDNGDEPSVPPPPCADKIAAFRHRFFPESSINDWNNWRWQVSHRIERCDQLEHLVTLTDSERNAFQFQNATLPLAITPYYASLIAPDDPDQPIRRAMVPVAAELLVSPGEAQDPLGEDGHSPVKGLIHRYPDRVLLLVTDYCSSYCRYCTRSRMVGKRKSGGKQQWQRAIDYIAAHPEVRDVLISGGDPLTLSDGQLDWLLGKVRAIDHVELIRIGTKVPMVLPQRITPALVTVLKRYHPLWISIHCMHPDELTAEARRACTMLADAGIPLGSQTVLLAGINDSVGIMKRLMHELVKIRVKPYYLYQCDPIIGSSHFRTSIATGLEIYQGLRGHTTGYAVPTYVIDAPGGGGKIPLLPETMLGWEDNDLLLRNYEGRIFRYPDQFAGFPGRPAGEAVPCV